MISGKYATRIVNFITYRYCRSTSERFVRYLRHRGCSIGENCHFRNPRTITIDLTRPCLITIGDYVHITEGAIVLTHGADWHVLRNLYREPFGSAGRVTIGSNVFIGMRAIILKGVSIGDHSIIGAGSVVTKNVRERSVVAGNPARVLFGIDEYYEKRKSRQVCEAIQYARAIKERYGRLPVPEDFKEFFHLFLDRSDKAIDKIGVKGQLGVCYNDFMKSQPAFKSFEEFLTECKFP